MRGRRAICGSIAVRHPELFAQWLTEFGPERLILGADIRDGKVAVQGWLETASTSAAELIEAFLPQGVAQVICTDISRDGMLCGPSAEFYAALQQQFPQEMRRLLARIGNPFHDRLPLGKREPRGQGL